MKSEDIIYYLTKYGDLLFRRYWVYTFIFGFIILFNILTVPEEGLSIKDSRFNNVDFPEPDGPTNE